MRLLSWILALPVIAVVVSYALSNRQTVETALWPLPFEVSLPLYLLVLGALGLGLVVGGFYGWLSTSHGAWRRRRRERRQAQRKGVPGLTPAPPPSPGKAAAPAPARPGRRAVARQNTPLLPGA